MEVAYTPNKKVAISFACCILLATCSITTWFWAGGIQDSKRQTNQSIGCSREVPMALPNRSEDAAFNSPSIRAGETINLENETIAQRLKIEIGGLVVWLISFFLPRDDFCFPKPAPRAKDDTNTSNDKGLAAFPKFWAVSKIIRNGAVDWVLPSLFPTRKFRKIGTVATTIPISTPITGGGIIFLMSAKIRFVWSDVVVPTRFFRFPFDLVASP
mmetsp:Transcript_28945/g.78405  ORF Transcript_28945/g.78405 Transcript_28945/m.78405 type:complete len:214 (-) Transcript_28945:259-900(-)